MDMSLHPSMNPTIPFSYNIIPSSNCGIISTTSNNNVALLTTTGPRMDCRIWSKLPQRILDRVVAFLPPPAFFRARCVCKRWYGLLFYASFLELYLQISPYRRHWFLFFKLKGVSSHIYRNNNNSPLAGPDHSRPTYEGYMPSTFFSIPSISFLGFKYYYLHFLLWYILSSDGFNLSLCSTTSNYLVFRI